MCLHVFMQYIYIYDSRENGNEWGSIENDVSCVHFLLNYRHKLYLQLLLLHKLWTALYFDLLGSITRLSVFFGFSFHQCYISVYFLFICQSTHTFSSERTLKQWYALDMDTPWENKTFYHPTHNPFADSSILGSSFALVIQ